MSETRVAVGYPRKRTERTAAVEAVRMHCRGEFPHTPCTVVRVENRTYVDVPRLKTWIVTLAR